MEAQAVKVNQSNPRRKCIVLTGVILRIKLPDKKAKKNMSCCRDVMKPIETSSCFAPALEDTENLKLVGVVIERDICHNVAVGSVLPFWKSEAVVFVLLVGASVTVSIAGHHGAQLVHMGGVGPQGQYLESH